MSSRACGCARITAFPRARPLPRHLARDDPLQRPVRLSAGFALLIRIARVQDADR